MVQLHHLNVSDTGLYELTITDNNGCRAYDDVHVSFYPETTISLGPDFSIFEGGDTTLSIGSGFLSYNWSNGSTADTALLNPGLSWVEIQDLNTCSQVIPYLLIHFLIISLILATIH